MKKDKVLPYIKLKYLERPEEGDEPPYPDTVCSVCGRFGISIGSTTRDHAGKLTHACEQCAIDRYWNIHGFATREAAAARRRRMFDVGYLFHELVIDEYLKQRKVEGFKDVPDHDYKELINFSTFLYNEVYTKSQKIRLEEYVQQATIERHLQETFNELDIDITAPDPDNWTYML